MTTEEQNWIANRCVKAKEKEGIILISHIIEIVNDFNKKRTCENCKYAKYNSSEGFVSCTNKESEMFEFEYAFKETHGCPEWNHD